MKEAFKGEKLFLLTKDNGKVGQPFDKLPLNKLHLRNEVLRVVAILVARGPQTQQAPTVPPVTQVEFIPGTQEGLACFIGKEPQHDQQGRLRYLLTGGVAVEVITGISRFHHDIDFVNLDYRNGWWRKYTTDHVVAQRYWAGMKFDPAYLEGTAWEASFAVRGQEHRVSTVHPAIILTQKLSDCWGRTPRERDLKDVMELTRFWLEQDKGSQRWASIVQAAITALPTNEQTKTRERVAPYLEGARQWREDNLLYRVASKIFGMSIVSQALVQACKP